jgi:hypothetical protein
VPDQTHTPEPEASGISEWSIEPTPSEGRMRQTLTYIHFRASWQLLSPDGPSLQLERERFQQFMQKLNSDPRLGDYDDLSYRPERCELAKVRGSHPMGGEAFSKVVYGAGQLSVVEEWADISADQFKGKFLGILRIWFECFAQTVAVMEHCCLRALVHPRHAADSRQFVGDRVLTLGPRLHDTFSKMPHQVGFTIGCERDCAGGGKLLIETKVSSWRDNRSVWVEVAGSAPMRAPVNAANLPAAEQPFTVCKDFLETEVVGLLQHCDTAGAPETQQ